MINRDSYPSQLFAGRQVLKRAHNLVVISGAGMSADSGIATFRGSGSAGTWDTESQVLATPDAFRANPQLVWERYLQRRYEARKAQPHAGYTALADWGRHANVTIITQNVDGLHTRAGSSTVVELHGTLFRFFCAENHHTVTGVDDAELVPRCPECQSYVRPAVVWFGEWLPDEAIEACDVAMREAQAIMLIGTSLAVSSPRSLLRAAAYLHIPIIEVNPEPTLPMVEDLDAMSEEQPVAAATVRLVGSASAVLPDLLKLENKHSVF